MNCPWFSTARSHSLAFALLILSPFAVNAARAFAQPSPAAISAFDAYAGALKARLDEQNRSTHSFLAPMASSENNEARLRRGELIVEQLTPPNLALSGALLHHWLGTAFAPGAKAADFEHLMEDFNAYPQRFSPQVLTAKLLSLQGDRFQVSMRVRQRHVITVVMDTDYDIAFSRLDARHGYSLSRSTRISEIDSPGTPSERPLTSAQEHGFLWRQNTYWSYEERDGGLVLQIESVSLSRSIPIGLGWAVRPFVESVPRESLEFTLRSVCTALRK